MCSLWNDNYEYPIQWSIELSKLDNDIGKLHKERLEDFINLLKGGE